MVKRRTPFDVAVRILRPQVPSVIIVWLLAAGTGGCSTRPGSFPSTEKHPVTDAYYGAKVVDDYRWLDTLDDPVVKKWNDEQNLYTRSVLDGVSAREAIVRRLTAISGHESPRYSNLQFRGRLFAMKSQPPRNQPFLVVFGSPGDTATLRVLVDPNALNTEGTTAIDWYVPSRDGKLVAVSLSENGSEDGTVSVFDVGTGAKLPDVVPRAQYPTASGSLEWNADATGFYYTRYPLPGERSAEDRNFYQQIFMHKLGTPSSEDSYVLGKQFPRIAECTITSTPDGRHFLVAVANGDGGEFTHYLLGPSGSWSRITEFSDRIVSAAFGTGNDVLFLLSRKNAPNGRILRLPLSRPGLSSAKEVVAQSDGSIDWFVPAENRLYFADIVGGPMRMRVLDTRRKEQTIVQLPPIASVTGVVRTEGGSILYEVVTYLDPPAWYLFDPATGRSSRTGMAEIAQVDFRDVEVVREFATSPDGTKVPMNILRRKGTALNGNNPTILYGYGGYNISETPGFSATRHLWLEQGGVYVIANLRGGGEYGDTWHTHGRLTEKQNVFDDFAACARHLIDTGYARPSNLAIEGGSNGGLLMGAALTQHPELYRAVVSYVGIYDMLRVELFPNGAFNVTEFGSVKDSEQFKALFAYSPYHHVIDGTSYPAVLFLTGDHDGRVDPANSRKMTARLQAATSSGLPIMLRTNPHAGHGIGTGLSDRTAQSADVYCFLVGQLKMVYKPVEE